MKVEMMHKKSFQEEMESYERKEERCIEKYKMIKKEGIHSFFHKSRLQETTQLAKKSHSKN
jgi:hypothetical protein